VALALRLGTDRAWRAEMRAAIQERSPLLYEQTAAVREVEAFFLAAAEAAARGERLTTWPA
jgi:hypothetical protein